MFKIIILLNIIWFGLAFHLFSIRNIIFAKTIIPREQRDTPVFDSLASLSTFLGGFNLAFFVLNVIILCFPTFFPEINQKISLLIVFAIAHGTQFAFNVPVALENKKGKGAWQIKGLMKFIFYTDFLIMIANLMMAVYYLFDI